LKIEDILSKEIETRKRLTEDLMEMCRLHAGLSKELLKDKASSRILQSRIAKRKMNIYASLLNGLKNVDRLSQLFANIDVEDSVADHKSKRGKR